MTAPGRTRPVVFSAPAIKRYSMPGFEQRSPGRFRPVSVTGPACALSCAHCDGVLLRSMTPVRRGERLLDVCRRLASSGAGGVLISGGCDRLGRVPLAGLGEDLGRARTELGLRVAVHTGLVDGAVASELAEAGIECAMLDVIGSAQTAERVYGLAAGPDDYEASLAALVEAGVATVPHIVIGLDFGRIVGERDALAIVARHAIAGLVFVVLTPLPGTRMAGVAPPAGGEIAALFAEARRALPDTPVVLGCARPAGPAGVRIERAAIDAGLDGIAFPSGETVRRARRAGAQASFSEACCALGCVKGP